MRYVTCLAWGVVAVMVIAANPVRGDTILGVEDPGTGFVGPITTNLGDILVASDSEAGFDPFGFGGDTTDDVKFATAGWLGDMPAATHWVEFAPGTWALPAINENEPAFTEDVGRWVLPGAVFNATAVGTYTILDGEGVSDRIVLANDGPGGAASVEFASDPIAAAVPLPGVAVGGLVLLGARAVRRGWRRIGGQA